MQDRQSLMPSGVYPDVSEAKGIDKPKDMYNRYMSLTSNVAPGSTRPCAQPLRLRFWKSKLADCDGEE